MQHLLIEGTKKAFAVGAAALTVCGHPGQPVSATRGSLSRDAVLGGHTGFAENPMEPSWEGITGFATIACLAGSLGAQGVLGEHASTPASLRYFGLKQPLTIRVSSSLLQLLQPPSFANSECSPARRC